MKVAIEINPQNKTYCGVCIHSTCSFSQCDLFPHITQFDNSGAMLRCEECIDAVIEPTRGLYNPAIQTMINNAVLHGKSGVHIGFDPAKPSSDYSSSIHIKGIDVPMMVIDDISVLDDMIRDNIIDQLAHETAIMEVLDEKIVLRGMAKTPVFPGSLKDTELSLIALHEEHCDIWEGVLGKRLILGRIRSSLLIVC